MYHAPTTFFDLLVIGGGITGAGIALDAATRGLRVLLLEKCDFAFGTSSRSTKLIHGGLRYLKQLEFGLVREVGSERAVVHALAPHLVVPETMLLPLYKKKGMGYWLASMGLKIYDWLAGVKSEDQRKMLTRQQTLSQEPLLKPDDVKGGALYAEYRTDDARLTIEILKTACDHGAWAVNYCCVTDFLYTQNFVSGVVAKDELTGQFFNVVALNVVNAAGPWVDDLREINRSKKGKQLQLTKGVHLVVPRERFNIAQAIYFDAGDGRMIFAIPRDRITYVGTTDTRYAGDKDNVHTDLADAEYILRAVNATFPTVHLQLADVESSWAGLRPLIHQQGKSASELSRKDEIFVSDSGLISIAGGKLTGYRKMAERIVDKVMESKFLHDIPTCKTAGIQLGGNDFANEDEVRTYALQIQNELQAMGLDSYRNYLVHNYGKQTIRILEIFKMTPGSDTEIRFAKAEWWFCVSNEMVIEPTDFFIRRTGMLYFDRHRMERVWQPVLEEFCGFFEWSPQKMEEQKNLIAQSLEKVHKFTDTHD